MLSSFRGLSVGASLCLGGLALGCSDNAAGPANELDVSSMARQAATTKSFGSQAAGNRGIEQEILRLESAIPGIGGMYVDGEEIVVFVPKDVSSGRVIAALAREAHTMAITSDKQGQLARGERIRIRPAKFPLSQLIAWEETLAGSFSHVDGFTGIDADESTNQVRINVADAATISAAQQLVAASGVPSDAVSIRIVPKAIAVAGLRGTWRPTGGGITISNTSKVCTLGFNATTNTGLNVIVTAGHCVPGAAGVGATGATEAQPNTANPVGTIQINPVWNQTDPGCTGYLRCTLADALLVQYTVASTMSKRVAFTAFPGLNEQGGSITVTGWWDNVVAPTTSYFVGQQVDKEGQTTGWTRGTISQTCVNTPVSDDYGIYMVLCADAVTGSRVGQGDSGGPVFIPPPAGQIHNPLYPVGILFGTAFYNDYDPTTGAHFCSSGCTYYLSHWSNIQAQLGLGIFPN